MSPSQSRRGRRGDLCLQSSLDNSYHHHSLFFLLLFVITTSTIPVGVDAFEQDLAASVRRRTSSFGFSGSSSSSSPRLLPPSSSSSSYLNHPYHLFQLNLKSNDCDSSIPDLSSSSTTTSRSTQTTKDVRQQGRPRRRQPELWLDLRDMAIHPKAAIDYIEDRLGVGGGGGGGSGGDDSSDTNTGTTMTTTGTVASSSFLPDRILLSQIVFQNLVDHSDLYLTCEPEILYQKNNAGFDSNRRSTRNNDNNNGEDFDVIIDNDDNFISDNNGGDSDDKSDGDSRSDKSQLEGSRIDIFSSSADGLSLPFGRLVSFGADVSVAVSDPWSAIDVLTKGRWLVLGDEDNSFSPTRTISEDEEILRINSVGDFIAIASSPAFFTVGSGLTATPGSGLILPTTTGTEETIVIKNFQSVDNDKTTSTEKTRSVWGGIAVPCRHKSSLMAFASIHQSTMASSTPLTLAGASTSTTTTISDSGILVQSSFSEQGDNISDESGQTSVNAELPTAIILPFDVDLWEMAFMLYG